MRKFDLFCKRLESPSTKTHEGIFFSVTYGDGISSILYGILERKGLIETRDGYVYLTEKGQGIWGDLRGAKD